VAVASASPNEGTSLGLVPGTRVSVHGIVVHDSGVPGTWGLARFFISCCAADALPIIVPVDAAPAARPAENEWLLVTGVLAAQGDRLVLEPRELQPIEEPASPYVSTNDAGSRPIPAGNPIRIAAAAAPAPVAPKAAPAVAPPPAAVPEDLPETGAAAGFGGRAARVYDLYYEHCKHYTYDALAWPQHARDATEAARLYTGPPREFQPPAFRGCLAGLGAGEATIDLKALFVGRVQDNG
jgi:hypothetical protein